MIYQPEQDSYLMQEAVKNHLKDQTNKNLKILDMGCGSGVQAQTCIDEGFDNVLALDINPESINHLKSKGINAIQSDLFSNISKENRFDLIIFNPPYLPLDKREPIESRLATTAGKKGYEIIVKFLKHAKHYLKSNGKILLLFSSLSKPKVILKHAKDLGYTCKKLSSVKVDFEELEVYEIK
ncbi:MAG: HemK2/MTQ2 family protein methyltransferase [Candidatus Nanoarchaeia archaeon]